MPSKIKRFKDHSVRGRKSAVYNVDVLMGSHGLYPGDVIKTEGSSVMLLGVIVDSDFPENVNGLQLFKFMDEKMQKAEGYLIGFFPYDFDAKNVEKRSSRFQKQIDSGCFTMKIEEKKEENLFSDIPLVQDAYDAIVKMAGKAKEKVRSWKKK